MCAPSPTLEAVLIDGNPLGAQTPERLRKPRDGRQNNTAVCGRGDAIIGPDLSLGKRYFQSQVTETPPKCGLRHSSRAIEEEGGRKAFKVGKSSVTRARRQ